ncbi:MAG: hypothetical protein KDD99_29235 [Bacteroidetes bacterium]|nr:hypothetical protein [Bacteroidota bacterium]
MIRTRIIFLLLIAGIIISGCGFQSEYTRLVTRELASGVRNDSLFLGIHFGMTSKEFYLHCWDLNEKQLVRQGNRNMTVEYQVEDLEYPASMNFYPDFHEDKIYEMPVSFMYLAWAPWNQEMSSDSLQEDVMALLMDWYGGNPFIKVEHPQKGAVHVKVDGNRRILIQKEEVEVEVRFTDMLVERAMKEEK